MIRAWRFLFLLLIVGLAVLSAIPADLSPPTFGISDKLQHFVAYFVLAFVATVALPGQGMWWRIALPLIVLGAVLEIVQIRVPGRYPEMADVWANALGVAGGLLARQAIQRLRKPRQT